MFFDIEPFRNWFDGLAEALDLVLSVPTLDTLLAEGVLLAGEAHKRNLFEAVHLAEFLRRQAYHRLFGAIHKEIASGMHGFLIFQGSPVRKLF